MQFVESSQHSEIILPFNGTLFCALSEWSEIIGASLSEPHTSVTSLHCVCVFVYVWLDLAVTVNFRSANFTGMCTIIFKFNELDELSSYLHVRQTMATTNMETTRGHWLEHHEHSSSSATLTKMETAR